MDKKIIKRSYNFPPELITAWEIFHSPSKDYSPSAAAAFLLYMVSEPVIRESLRKLACLPDIEKSKIVARKILRETITDAFISGFIGIHSPEDRKILLENFLTDSKNTKAKTGISNETLKKIVKAKPAEFSVIYKILSEDEQKEVDILRDELGPDSQIEKHKKSG